ncbi:MAG: hypothetical protein EXS23_02240 [Pedosphaera sp.]|nr:hypothetical protein [Pedosphaera sp.]
MFGRPKNKNGEAHRYYLLPGMGRANRRRRHTIRFWTIIVGLLTGLAIGCAFYVFHRLSMGY